MIVNFLNKEMKQETRDKFYNMCEECVNYNDLIIAVEHRSGDTYSVTLNLVGFDELQSEFFSALESDIICCDNYFICKCLQFAYRLLKAKETIIKKYTKR